MWCAQQMPLEQLLALELLSESCVLSKKQDEQL